MPNTPKYQPIRRIRIIETEDGPAFQTGVKKPIYPPLRLINLAEKNVPNYFDAYDFFMSRVSDPTLEYSASHALVDHYYPTLDESQHMAKASLGYVLSSWRKNKMVYSFSEELQTLLCDTEDFTLDSSLFDYLPYQTFYIELRHFGNYHGILIRHTHNQYDHILSIIPICINPLRYFIMNFDLEDGQKFYEAVDQSTLNCKGLAREPLKRCLIIGVQASMYLCAQNSDIQENEKQKRIYRPSERIQNKFSEIRKWDVGYRIVKENKNLKKILNQQSNPVQKTVEKRRPRMHWRKAHWHTFWAGEGRKKKVLHFLAPILVNETNDELPVVQHVSD